MKPLFPMPFLACYTLSMSTITNFFLSLKYIFTDKINFMLTILPVLVGLIFYGAGFYSILGWVGAFKFGWLGSFFGLDSWIISGLIWIVKTIIGFLAYFIANWTFVIFVSAIGCFFNDYISERVEKRHIGQPLPPINQAFSKFNSKILFILMNELKKISFILFFSLLAYIINFIPFLVPVSLGLSFILVSVQFIDYTWYRHNLTFSQCLSDTNKNFFTFILSGALYFALINIPILNLFVPAIATAHYAIHFSNKHTKS